jgi:predicted enzyme related to lactoylglutathione lyase
MGQRKRDRIQSHFEIGIRQRGMNTLSSIVYNVHNLDMAKAIQTALLGVGPHTESPYYVGFNVAGFEIALVPHGPDNTAPPVPIAYISVPELEAAISEVCLAGATLASAPTDVGGGTRTATFNDPDGNTLGLVAHTVPS